MSYLKGAKTELRESMLEVGVARIQKGSEEIDCNLDDELLSGVLEIIGLIDGLQEGQALVIWKEIF